MSELWEGKAEVDAVIAIKKSVAYKKGYEAGRRDYELLRRSGMTHTEAMDHMRQTYERAMANLDAML